MTRFLRAALSFVALCFIASCSREPRELVLSGPTMGTTYTVKVVGTPDTLDAEAIRRELDAVLANIDAEMSIYRSDSAISKFNANASTDWLEVPVGLARVVAVSRDISERSGGSFDITIAPLIAAWGFGPSGEPTSLPSQAELAALRDRMGYRLLDVRLSPPALRKQHPALTIDVNGVAPGYAVDLLAERFEALGVRRFMIDIGGEVLARGRNARGEPWRIAVEQPIDGEQTPFKILELTNASVTTSGEYRHYFDRDGQRYSHTLDPRSGRPIASYGSVCVVGKSSLVIDAWATALNVLGPDEGLQVAEREGLAAMYIVVDAGKLEARMSSAFPRASLAE
jgi:thiamine biosynthesis lipoprotein